MRIAISFTALALLAACSDTAPDTPPLPERADSAGVEIVMNPGPDRLLDWTFEPEVAIGGADEGPESFYEVGDFSIDAGDDGVIYLMDSGNKRLRAFAADGSHLWSAGREGGGPGEFEFAFEVSASPEGPVVLDSGRRAFIRYGLNGELLGETPMDDLGFGTEVGYLPTGDAVLRLREDLEDEERWRHRLIIASGADSTGLHTAVKPRPSVAQLFACGITIGLRVEPIFEAGYLWSSAGNRVAAAWGWPDYRVDVHASAGGRTSVRRTIVPQETDAELAAQEIPDGMTFSLGGGGPCTVSPDELVEKRGWTTPMPTISEIRLAPDGELWVRREVLGDDDEPAPIDVFGPDGAYLGTLPPGTPFPATFLPDGSPVTVEEDELEIPHIVIYRVDREPPANECPGGSPTKLRC